jgi:hypothetical protein
MPSQPQRNGCGPELPQSRLSSPGEIGVSGVSAYWLVDPEGRIIREPADPDELAELLTSRLK